MTLDVVNGENKKVGSVDLNDAVFAGPIKTRPGLGIGRAAERVGAARHAHDQEPRARQRQRQEAVQAEGHGPAAGRIDRARRSGGTAARCSGRSRAATTIALPKKVERGALRAALTAKLRDGAVMVVDELQAAEKKTKAGGRAAEAAGRDRARRSSST